MGWCINGKAQFRQALIDFFIVDGVFFVRQFRVQRNWLVPDWEITNVLGIIISLDMMPGSGNSDSIQYFKKVKVQLGKQIFGRPFPFWKFAPGIIDLLGPAEYYIDI